MELKLFSARMAVLLFSVTSTAVVFQNCGPSGFQNNFVSTSNPNLSQWSLSADFQPVNSDGDRQVFWGAWIDGIPIESQPNHLDRAGFNQMSRKKMSISGFNTWWFVGEDFGAFSNLFVNSEKPQNNWANIVSDEGAVPMLLWNAYNPIGAPKCNEPGFIDHIRKFSPARIAAGDFDNYIRHWAYEIKQWGRPIHIRTMHELNMVRNYPDPCQAHFTSWDAELTLAGQKINQREDVIAAWRHIVTIFRQQGADNVKWVWSVLSAPSPNFGGQNPMTLQSIYPGDDYVDFIGIECYNFTAKDWLSCADLMRGIYKEATALSPSKPILNVEMGSIEDPRKAAWIAETFSAESPNAIFKLFPRLAGVMYWNDGRSSADFSGLWIQSSAASKAAFQNAIRDPVYVAGVPRPAQVEARAHSFVYSSWSACSNDGCLSGSQTRSVVRCQNSIGQTVANSLCGTPVLKQPCSATVQACHFTMNAMTAAQARAAVIAAFQNVLGRTAAEAAPLTDPGFDYWTQKLIQGFSLAEFHQALLASNEFLVRELYRTIFKRAGTLVEISYYVKAIEQGTMTRSHVQAHFVSVCQQALDGECVWNKVAPPRELVVSAFIKILGRTAAENAQDEGGIGYWEALVRGGMTAATLESNLRASDEFYIRGLYTTIFQRRPVMQEVQYWLEQIKSGLKSREAVRLDLEYACRNKIGGECR